ncbi:SGNH/GDSL hydrolase family protein [Humibacter ginsengisoli]
MVALGSSFASGAGISPIVNRLANRSGNNYAHLVAAAIGADLTDATVGGATTETVLRKPQRVGLYRFPPQIEAIPRDSPVDLVTITAGGNDLHYLGSLLSAAYGSRLDAHPVTRALGRRMRAKATAAPPHPKDVNTAARGLVDIVKAVRDRAPSARILLVNYLTIIGTRTIPSHTVPFTTAELLSFRTIADHLRDAFAIAAHESHAELIDVAAASDSHAIGSATPWVQDFADRRKREAALFHPTLAGMRAVSNAILNHVGLPD